MSFRESAWDLRDRILLTDDDAEELDALAEHLKNEGFAVDCAGDGSEAAFLLNRKTYDLLVADAGMPGNQELELIHGFPGKNAGLPVILLGGCPPAPETLQAGDLMVFACLPKPVDFGQLLDQIRRGLVFSRVAGTLGNVASRLQRWNIDIQTIRERFQSSPGATASETLLGALTLSLGGAAQALLDMEELIHLAVGLENLEHLGTLERPGCPLPRCPRKEALEEAIREGIRVLEGTKDRFRSKEMGALRKRFESLVGEE
jgi:DNA-binding response OmpR family regulator